MYVCIYISPYSNLRICTPRETKLSDTTHEQHKILTNITCISCAHPTYTSTDTKQDDVLHHLYVLFILARLERQSPATPPTNHTRLQLIPHIHKSTVCITFCCCLRHTCTPRETKPGDATHEQH